MIERRSSIIWFIAIFLFCWEISWGQITIISDDFEDGNIAGWTESTSGRWSASSTEAINGSYSLKHSYDNSSADRDRISFPINSLSLAGGIITWRFQAKHGYNPSANNNWAVFLMSDLGATEMYPSGNADGYAVGVNYSGSDDKVKLWRISSGAGYVVVDTDFDWESQIGTATAVGFEIAKTSNGDWTLKIDSDGGFDNLITNGTGSDTTHNTCNYFGVYHEYTATRDQKLWIDDIFVTSFLAVTISDSSGFRMMSSPVSGPIYGDLLDELWTQGMTGGDITSGPANVWTYADTGWSALTDISSSGDTLTAGQGFLVYVFADTDFDGTDDLPVTLSVSGTENSGSITVPSTGSIADDAWELAGNPYASTIVWDSVTQTNVSATAYVWNNAIADYITWNGTTGSLSNGLIAPFQGFWVQGSGGSGSITIETADTSSTAGTFYRTMHDSSTGSMSFTITADAYSDQAYVSFTNNGEEGIDNADAYKLLPLTVSERVVGITYADDQSLAINNLPYVMDDALVIPFDVMYLMVEGDTNFVTTEHPVTLTWDLSNLPETVVGLTLTDNITSDTYDLLNPDPDAIIITTVAKGSFLADGSDGVNIYPQLGDSHFTLTVAYSALSAEDESTLPKEFALHRIYPNPFNPSATISFDIPPVETYNNTLLRVYDIKGRRVATLVDAPYKPGTHTVQWHPQNFSSGLYIVQFKAGDKTFNQKITFIK